MPVKSAFNSVTVVLAGKSRDIILNASCNGGTTGGSGNGTSKHRDGNKKGDSGDAENIHFGIVEWWPQTDVGFVQLQCHHTMKYSR